MKITRNIIIGLLLFIGLVSVPFWFNLNKSTKHPKISLDTPEIQALEVKKCIEDTQYMRAKHMELLADWKVEVVREGNRIYVAKDGREYLMCIEQTCLYCHSNKSQFCDACHEFAGVKPNCWSCHNEKQ
ncbi:MAG: sulfate reduction electron transfer complex DsrMKJOP subunit DsrJ [Bacillota bacterium]